MSVDVILPALDSLMEKGTIVQWIKADGERVEKGQPIAVIETEKVTAEIESPASGILKVACPVGSTVAVREVIGHIHVAGTDMPEAKPLEVSTEKKENVEEVRGRSTPAARKLARERGIDITKIKGTGPGGIITRDDVVSQVAVLVPSLSAAKLVQEEEVIPLVGWRKTMAEKMAQSKRTAAHITTVAEVDVTELLALREKILPVLQEKEKLKITVTPFIVKAVAQALQEYPIVNSSLLEDKIIVKKYCNIGIAMAREEGGLVVPVIHHAEEMNLLQTARKLEELTEKAKAGKLAIEDVRGGTFTITNVGMMGVIFNTPIINPPETAILSAGAIVKKPVVIEDQIVIRYRMYLTLSYDHRVVDGAPAIRFLQRVRQLLENSYSLLPF
jgi:pyruvate/2-oxoglutarate dehydrogenase complex dihydrolipoamide acyltransferase (E2) component